MRKCATRSFSRSWAYRLIGGVGWLFVCGSGGDRGKLAQWGRKNRFCFDRAMCLPILSPTREPGALADTLARCA